MNASPLCPGDSKLGCHLRKARVKIWSGMLGVLVAFHYCGKHQGQKHLGEDGAYIPQSARQMGIQGKNLEAETEADQRRKPA